MGRDGGHGAAEAVYQQKQLPTAKDPKMWCLKCNKAGKEKEVVIAMARKLNKLEALGGRGGHYKEAPKEKTPVRKPPKDAGTWVRQWSAQHKREYFFNSETKDTTWRLPEGGLEVLDPKCVAAATSYVPCAIFCLFAQPFSPAFCLAAAEAVLHAGDGNWRMYCNSAAGSCAHMAR